MNKNKLRDFFSIPLSGLLYVISLLPLFVLYQISGLIYFLLYRIFRYRIQIVRRNLQNSFPSASCSERKQIEKQFYRHFADVMVEVIKLRTLSFSQLKKRCRYSEASVQLLDRFYREGKSVMVALAHTANWEWAGASFPLFNQHQVLTAYRPLRNKTFDKSTLRMRKRTGNFLEPMRNIPRAMFQYRDRVMATALIADQTPRPENAFWIEFLNQQTPFYKGTEVLSQKFNLPLIWGCVRRIKRGYYQIELELITEHPRDFKEPGALTRKHAAYLERDLQHQPAYWLWTHRRWKHNMYAGGENSDK